MSRLSSAGNPRAWWFALIGALAFLAFSRAFQLHVFLRSEAFAAAARPAPARDARSPTGYVHGQRDQILEPGDSYHWVMQTQQMLAQPTLRPRRVDYDNAPEGREVHWSSSMRWWLAGVSWLESKFTGEPWAIAMERAAVYANMLLLPLLMVGLVPVVAKRFGAWPAGLLAVGMVTISAFRAEFGVAVLDHHGVVCTCALMAVVFIGAGAAGWTRGEKREGSFVAWLPTFISARRWFIASGISGGVGLWISASTLIPVLGGIGIGALVGMFVDRADRAGKTEVRFEPRLWRWWGFAGCCASLGFYALEYFPGPFRLRLEVNHPLYAFAWLAAGDVLCRIGEARQGVEPASRVRFRFLLGLSCVAVVLPLLAILVFGERVFVVGDPVLWLHRQFISEFASALRTLQTAPANLAIAFLVRDVTPLPLLVIPAMWWLRKRLPPAARSIILIAICPAIVATLLGLEQIRWLNLSGALWIAAVVMLTHVRQSLLYQYPWRNFELPALAVLIGVTFLSFPYDTISKMVRSAASSVPAPDQLRAFVGRDAAHWLRERVGDNQVVIAAAAATTTDLIYFGGFKGIGTFYWENRAGLRAAVELHAAKTPDAAYAILQRHGVTHWVIFSWDDFAVMSAGLDGKTNPNAAIADRRTFILDILQKRQPLPAWMRPLPYAMPYPNELRNDWALMFEILPPPSASSRADR